MFIDFGKMKTIAESTETQANLSKHKEMLDSYCKGRGDNFKNLLYVIANKRLEDKPTLPADILFYQAAFMAEFYFWQETQVVAIGYSAVDPSEWHYFLKTQRRFKADMCSSIAWKCWWRFHGPFGWWRDKTTPSYGFRDYLKMLRDFSADQWIKPNFQVAQMLATD